MNPRRAAARGRQVARRMMIDRMDFGRPTGGWTTDPDTGLQVPELTAIHADVPAWIRVLAQQSRIHEVAGEPVTTMAYDILVPHTVDGLKIDDVGTVTKSSGTDLQGRTLVLFDVTWGTHQVARRLVARATPPKG